MRTVEERLSYQEAKMEEVGKAIVDLKSAIAALDQKMDRRFDQVESRFFWMMGIQFSILIAIIVGLLRLI